LAAPPLDSPCDGPVTYPGDIKTPKKSSKGRSGRKTEEEMEGPTSSRGSRNRKHA